MKTKVGLGILNTAQRFIFGTGLTFNMILAAYYVQKGFLTIGDLIMIQTLMLQFLNPLFFLGTMYRTFVDTFIEVKELYNIMERPANVLEGSKQVSKLDGKIEFRNVSFKYILDGSQILDNISFTVEPNQFVAVIGESGSGKSTILNMIFRLYDAQKGEILLDGENIKNLSFDFRKHITFVSQAPYLFNGTVLENLQYAHPASTQEEI